MLYKFNAVKFLCLSILLASSLSAKNIPPEKILKRVDDIRNPGESYFMKVQIDSADDVEGPWKGEVKIKGNNRTLIITQAPARQKGQNLLMIDEEMWLYIPNLKRAVRISLSQKLTGQASNGDIGRMRWYGDYDVKIEKESRKYWHLFLTARKKGLTYEKIRIVVSKRNFHPLKAEFLSLGSKVLKTARYKRYKRLAGRIRPSEIKISDAIDESNYSTIKILEMEKNNYPLSLFNRNNLK
jgi:outer membrane lipoprotein-sorting protein